MDNGQLTMDNYQLSIIDYQLFGDRGCKPDIINEIAKKPLIFIQIRGLGQ